MMKKALALLLAVLTVFSSMVFTVAAEDATNATTMTTGSELLIVPMDDCTGPSTVKDPHGVDPTGDGWYGKDADYFEDGTYGVTIEGYPIVNGAGNTVNLAFRTDTPRDISGMTVLEFDLYLENAAAVASAMFEFEIRSAGYNGDSNEIQISKTLNQFADGALKDGWNHIQIPLDANGFNIAAGGDFDPTQFCYFRIFNQQAAVDNKITEPRNAIGTTGKTTVFKVDNFYFSNRAISAASHDLILIPYGGQGTVVPGEAYAEGTFMSFDALLSRPHNITDYITLEMDIYLSHEDAKKLGLIIEMTSSGTFDAQETNYGTTIAELAARSGTSLTSGWNHISLPLATASGEMNPEGFNYIRIYNAALTGSEVAPGESRTISVGRVYLSGDRQNDDSVLLMTGGSSTYDVGTSISGVRDDRVNENGEVCRVKNDGTIVPVDGVATDGVMEWLWIDQLGSSYTINNTNGIAYAAFANAKPQWADLGGLEFDIWVSDASFGELQVTMEMTSGGSNDKNERYAVTKFNSLIGTTLKANEWQTVSIKLSSLTGTQGGDFSPVDFNYFRFFASGNKTFDNGLLVVVRNIRAVKQNYFAQPVEDKNGNPIINNESDGNYSEGNRIAVTGKDGNVRNFAGRMLDLTAGETITASYNKHSNDSVLKAPIDATHADWIGFDLYLENVEEWGAKLKFLFGISSSGTYDKQQITKTGSIYEMYGNFVVNEDGSKGELKNGWNRIEAPIYSMFASVSNGVVYQTGTTEIDRTKSGPILWDEIDFYRTYIMGTTTGSDFTFTNGGKAAIDNITFFDGDVIGTRDDIVPNDEKTIWNVTDAAGIAATKSRVQLNSKFFPRDLSDKAYMQMDVYLSEKAITTGATIQLEFSSDSILLDNSYEKQISFKIRDFGLTAADANTWVTVRIALPATYGTDTDVKGITRVEVFNSTDLPQGFVFKTRNLCFVRKDSLDTKLVSAQPVLTEGIDLTIKGNVNTTTVKAAALELSLSGNANTNAVVVPTSFRFVSDGKSATLMTTFDGIPAHRMGDTFTMKLWTLGADGKLAVAQEKTYSVKEYCTNMLAKYPDNTMLCTLIGDLLTYGAATQNYISGGYGTPVTDGLVLTTTAFNADALAVHKLKTVLSGNPEDDAFDATFKSVTLVLDGMLHIRYIFTANTTDGLRLNIGNETYTTFNMDNQGRYYVDVPVYASQFATVFTATFNGNENYAVNYSVNHYLATKHAGATSENMKTTKALLEAIYNYGVSASNYVTQDKPDWEDDGVLRILTIGNSFSDDTMQYVYQIAESLGVEKIELGNLYIGGCSLDTHATNARGDLAAYDFRQNTYGSWETIPNYKMSDAISLRNWDFISLQQASGSSGIADTYAELDYLIGYVSNLCPTAKLVWNMTWAYQQDSTHQDFSKYNNNQMTMYESILSAVNGVVLAKDDISLVIPNGTAIQNARTSYLGDTLTRDGFHLSLDLGRYIAGLTMVYELTGLSPENIEYAPEGVDEYLQEVAVEAAINAINTPFAVTTSTYTTAPSTGETVYEELDLDWKQYQYWIPTVGKGYTLSSANTLYSTCIFTPDELPVGTKIVLAEGWKYRPVVWINGERTVLLDEVTTAGEIIVTEEWWGNYTERAFNIKKLDGSDISSMDPAEVMSKLKIYIPVTDGSYKLNLGWRPYTYWTPTVGAGYTLNNNNTLYSTRIFTREDLPVGSVIELAEGWKYRPVVWINGERTILLDEVTTAGEIIVTEEWWGNYTERAFNIKKLDGTDISGIPTADVMSKLEIYVPVSKEIELDLGWTASSYWHSSAGNGNHQKLITGNASFYGSRIITREELPVGSRIVLADGWMIRPEAWVDGAKNEDPARPGEVTGPTEITVDEAWWGNFTQRAFNLYRVGKPSLAGVSEETIEAALRVYAPRGIGTSDLAQ